MKEIVILVLIVTIIGCSTTQDNNSIIVDKFPLEKQISGEKITIPEILFKPTNMHIVDSFLIVLQTSGKNVFHFFNLPNLKYIKSVGTIGKGPNEFNSISSGTFTVGKNKYFSIIDKQINMRIFDTKEVLTNEFKPINKILMPVTLHSTYQMVFNGDSIIYGHARNEKSTNEIFSFNIFSNEIKPIAKYDDLYKDMSNYDKSRLFFLRLGLKPDGTKLVSAYYYHKKIKIFDLLSHEVLEINFKDSPGKNNVNVEKIGDEYSISIRESTVFYSGDIRTTDQYIYAEIYNEPQANLPPQLIMANRRIQVFDWSGNPVASIKLKEPFDCYAVSNDDEYLYTISGYEVGKMFRYKISDILN